MLLSVSHNLGLQCVNLLWLPHLLENRAYSPAVAQLINHALPLGDNGHVFHEEGVFNYSTMLLREDLDLLVLGAREAVYALDLNDISKKLASVRIPLLLRPVPLWRNAH